jgi:hypothetical protein
MIKSYCAVTREIDDAEAAVAEILAGLNLKENRLENSLGIIACFSEFADTGVLKAVCDALPFDCIGATSCICSSDGDVDQIFLSVMMLTSADCQFKTASVAVDDGYADKIGKGLADILGNGEPKLLLTYMPLINEFGGDMMIEGIDMTTGGQIPLFGTMAIDHNKDFATAMTIYNGEAHRRSIVFGAVYGEPDFTFELASLDHNKMRKQKAIITGSDKNLLTSVNEKPVVEYLEEIGMTRDELAQGLVVIPLLIEHKSNPKPVARAVIALTPEGHAVCGGSMTQGATIAVGRLDAADILATTEKTLTPFMKDGYSLLTYSCMSRYLVLGAVNDGEAKKVDKITGDNPYIYACSGGEICPLADENGMIKNTFHNFSIVFCRIR